MIFRLLGAQWLAAGFVGAVSFGISILVARMLGPDLFGVYAIALSVGVLVAILIDGGFGKLLQRERARVTTSLTELLPDLPGLAYGHAVLMIFGLSVVVLSYPAHALTSLAALWFFGAAGLNQFGLAILRGDGRLVRDATWQIEPLFRPQSAVETLPVLSRHAQHGQYLLAVGTLEPRKNLQVALQAFMQLPPAMRKHHPLVLVGMTGWHTSALEAQMAPMIRAGEVRQLGYLSRTDLAAVIAGALTLIYPSIYEGFGLPPLEAMACGVPVIAADVSSLPEVVGDTGVLINPHDAEAVAQAIQRLVTDPATRGRLSVIALARSKEFTWDRCVTQTLGAYQQALNSVA